MWSVTSDLETTRELRLFSQDQDSFQVAEAEARRQALEQQRALTPEPERGRASISLSGSTCVYPAISAR